MWLRQLTLLLTVLLTVGCTTLPEPDSVTLPDDSPPAPSLKIVTYNINWGCPNPNQVANYLLQSDADIICLQETHRQWELLLNNHLLKTYPYGTFHSWRGAGGIAIVSKYPLSNIRFLEPDAGWFPALLLEADTNLGLIQILNVHLRPPLNDNASATVSAYLESSNIHKKELAGFLDSANLNKPLLIAGDFNEHERRSAITNLLDEGFTDALSQYDTKSNTWSWRTSSGFTLKNRYDHILFNKYFHCTGASVADVRASDHRPVMAVLVNNMEATKTP